MSIELPKSLERAMRLAGFVDPRTDNPSLNQWSNESGVHTSTISSFLTGRRTKPANVHKMAAALDVNPAALYGMAGRELFPWSPPSGTERLNTRQRQALNELILAFVDEGPVEKVGDGSEHSATSMNEAEGNSAIEEQLAVNLTEAKKRRRSKPRLVPDLDTMAADESGETEKERLNREAAHAGEESQVTDDE